jgi:hypothetical protein
LKIGSFRDRHPTGIGTQYRPDIRRTEGFRIPAPVAVKGLRPTKSNGICEVTVQQSRNQIIDDCIAAATAAFERAVASTEDVPTAGSVARKMFDAMRALKSDDE